MVSELVHWSITFFVWMDVVDILVVVFSSVVVAACVSVVVVVCWCSS